MNETLMLVVALAVGVALGAFFFGGLWWTVRRCVSGRCAPLWLSGSLLVRTAAVLAGFYSVSAWRWERLLACLAGFVLARSVATFLARRSE